MTLTFPRAFPDLCAPVSGVTDLKRFQTTAFDGDGGISSVEVAPSIIRSQYSVTARGRASVAVWRAFFQSLRGGNRSLQGVPIRDGRKFYRWPLARPQGFAGLTYSASPWNGLGNLSDIGDSKDTITIDELPNGLLLSPGDYISYPFGTVNRLHMIVEGGTVSANAVTVTVEPIIRQDVTLDDPVAVTFEYPFCTMSIAGEVSESGDQAATTFSFTAYAKVR